MKEAFKAQVLAAQEFFDRSTGALTEEDSGFAPGEGAYTAASQIAHAAQTIDWFINGAFDPKGFDLEFESHDHEARAVTSIGEARERFKTAIESACSVIDARSEDEWAASLPDGPVMGGQPRSSIFGGITDHTAHHRGALTAYARALGKTPPNPYM